MLLLTLGILTLWVGLALWPWLKTRANLLTATDTLVVVTVGGLVLLHITPHAVEDLGGWAILALILGIATPSILERVKSLTQSAPMLLGLLIFTGVTLHAFVDGVALSSSLHPELHHGHAHGAEGNIALASAIIVHRFPAGLALGWFVGESKGMKAAISGALIIAAATCAGWLSQDIIPMSGHGGWMAAFEAFIAGSLLHLLLGHKPEIRDDQDLQRQTRWGWGGAFIGAAALLTMSLSSALLKHADLELSDGLWPPIVIAALLAFVHWRLHHPQHAHKAARRDQESAEALSATP